MGETSTEENRWWGLQLQWTYKRARSTVSNLCLGVNSRNQVLSFIPANKFLTTIHINVPSISAYARTKNSNPRRNIPKGIVADPLRRVIYTVRFQYRKIPWSCLDISKSKNSQPYFAIDGKNVSSLPVMRTLRGPNIDSDHHLLSAKMGTHRCVEHRMSV